MRTADAGPVVAVVLAGLWVVLAVALTASRRYSSHGSGALLAASGAAVALLGTNLALVDAVAHGTGVALFDAPVHQWFLAHRTATLDGPMMTVSTVGGAAGMVALALVATVLLLRVRRRAEAVVVVVATGGAEVLGEVFKQLYQRPRPPVADQLVPTTSYALPSGHSLGSAVVLGVLATVVVLLAGRRVVRYAAVVVAAAGVLLIGTSRLYLGVHWPTDVLSGYLLGGAWLAVCIGALVLLRRRSAPLPPAVPGTAPGAAVDVAAPAPAGRV